MYVCLIILHLKYNILSFICQLKNVLRFIVFLY
ncbi:hypothetical protein [Staphylococcus phage vB_SauM-V1SA19]|nr:hypothetical protein [Staphylococcus phage vB_SauM-V1SA19]UVT34772.1 hypothetical protein [Staphylococcus phage vB_SauM-V1SA20]